MKLVLVVALMGFFYLLYPGEAFVYGAPGGIYRLEYREATPETCRYRVTQLGGPFTYEGVLARGEESRELARVPALRCADEGLYATGSQWQLPASLTALPLVVWGGGE